MFGPEGRPQHCCAWLGIASSFPECASLIVPEEVLHQYKCLSSLGKFLFSFANEIHPLLNLLNVYKKLLFVLLQNHHTRQKLLSRLKSKRNVQLHSSQLVNLVQSFSCHYFYFAACEYRLIFWPQTSLLNSYADTLGLLELDTFSAQAQLKLCHLNS